MNNDKQEEFWYYIPGSNYNYMISTNANIWSLKSKKFIKQRKDFMGYYKAQLCIHGIKRTRIVRMLMESTFLGIGECYLYGEYFEHIDGDVSNDKLDNLRRRIDRNFDFDEDY